MKQKVLYRQVQGIPFEKLYTVRELDKKMDDAMEKIGFPRPRRYRSFTSPEMSQTRVQEREFAGFVEFSKAINAWANDEDCQRFEIEKKNYVEWERAELYYYDDPDELTVPWLQMAAEKEPTVQYTVNENYTMPD